MRGAGADLPEVDGAADGGERFGGGRPGAAQLRGGDVAVGLPGGVPEPAAGAVAGSATRAAETASASP